MFIVLLFLICLFNVRNNLCQVSLCVSVRQVMSEMTCISVCVSTLDRLHHQCQTCMSVISGVWWFPVCVSMWDGSRHLRRRLCHACPQPGPGRLCHPASFLTMIYSCTTAHKASKVEVVGYNILNSFIDLTFVNIKHFNNNDSVSANKLDRNSSCKPVFILVFRQHFLYSVNRRLKTELCLFFTDWLVW